MRSNCSRAAMRAILPALSRMRSGFLVAAGNGTTSPPAAVMLAAKRPGSARTRERPPARTTAPAISTTLSSAPPASSRGMICSMVGRSLGTGGVKLLGFWRGSDPSHPTSKHSTRYNAWGLIPVATRLDRMAGAQSQFLSVGAGERRRRIAYLRQPAVHAGKPGLVWLCGLKSEMTSTKAAAIAEWAQSQRLACLRFDYSGHGQSEGRFEDGTISSWLEGAEAAFRALPQGPQILIGSSLGGYIALLLLRKLLRENRQSAVGSRQSETDNTTADCRLPIAEEAARIKALVLIAPAWDMTELMWQRLPSSARRDIEEKGVFLRPSRYGDGAYPITRALIEDGKKHLIGSAPLDPGRPVHIIHGLQDPDVPWEHTLDLVAHLSGDWTRVTAVPDGEHRLSRPEDIALLLGIIGALVEGTPASSR